MYTCTPLRTKRVLALFALRRSLRFPVPRCCHSSDFLPHVITPISAIPILLTLARPYIGYLPYPGKSTIQSARLREYYSLSYPNLTVRYPGNSPL